MVEIPLIKTGNAIVKIIWRQSENYIMAHRRNDLLNITIILFFIIWIISYDIAQANELIKEKSALAILKNSKFGNSITKLTRFFPLYHFKSRYLFYYVSNGWQADHTNEGLVVFINNRYHHDYYINQTCNFKVVDKHLICHFRYFPGEVETNLLSDVFAGKKIVIGGSEERPWCGSKQVYR